MRKAKLVLVAAVVAAAMMLNTTGAAAAQTRTVEGTVMCTHDRDKVICADAEGTLTEIYHYLGARTGHRVLLQKDESGKVVGVTTPKLEWVFGTVKANIHGNILVEADGRFYMIFNRSEQVKEGQVVWVQKEDNCTPDDLGDDKIEEIVWECPMGENAV